jgi:hypothetical protein
MAQAKAGKAKATGKKTAASGTKIVKKEEPPKSQLAVSRYEEEDVGAGFEDMTSDDMVIPFLIILQKGSPQVDEDAPEYIDGAKAGMLMNSATGEMFVGDEGVLFLPIHREHKFMEWIPRDSGGGLVGRHDPTDPMIIEAKRGGAFGKLESPDGNDLVETFYVYGLLVDEDAGMHNPALLAFSSTQIKHYKKWMTQLRSIQLRSERGERITPPMFAHLFRLRSRSQSNNKGSWHGWDIRFSEHEENGETAAERSRLEPEDELYIAAKEIRSLVVSDRVQVAYETAGRAEVAQNGDDDTY